MKIFLIACCVLFSSSLCFSQNENQPENSNNFQKRIAYLKQHHIYVETLSFDSSKLSADEVATAKKVNSILNDNLRLAFNTFWDLSDTVLYIQKNEEAHEMQQDSAAIFITVENVTQHLKDLNITNPSNAVSFDDLEEPFISNDTSLLLMIEQVRFLRYSILTGDKHNSNILLEKIILVDKVRTGNPRWDGYVDDVMKLYRQGVATVDKNIIINAVLSRNNKYLYVDHGWLINAEDGSLVAPL